MRTVSVSKVYNKIVKLEQQHITVKTTVSKHWSSLLLHQFVCNYDGRILWASRQSS